MAENNSSYAVLKNILRNQDSHWVGDGFPVRTLFFYEVQGQDLSPFLLLDYAGPREFPPTDKRLGVGTHPHRGFETVTIVYSGEVEHRDSSGGGGKIGPGDVQWMTAASGLVHEEFHGRDYARTGGMFEMVQLWVNLPAEHKMVPPRYQGMTVNDIPVVTLDNDAGSLRVIAGQYRDTEGPVKTYSPVNVFDLKLNANTIVEIDVPEGFTRLLVVLNGHIQVNDEDEIDNARVGLFERQGDRIKIQSTTDTSALLLTGKPLDEPIVGYGPFVMNSTLEIHEAMDDFKKGKMGQLS
ncbi:MAG: pirin family protein [Gammaproteobacteria bacterium]|nr:pirin family protein [Gammaproteobacteria bacterium]